MNERTPPMMKMKQYKEWQEAVASWKQSKDKNSRQVVVIAPTANKEHRRVLLIHSTEGMSWVDIEAKYADDIVREVGTFTALLVDLHALGVEPLPGPVPPP